MILFFLFLLNSFCFSKNDYQIEKTEFVSEYAFYDSSSSVVNLSTDVIINLLDKDDNIILNIKTNEAVLNLNSSDIFFSTFQIETSSIYIKGGFGKYNFDLNNAKLWSVVSNYDRFTINSKLTEIENNKHIYKKAYFTTCNYEPPHYKITSSRIVFFPSRYFVSYNNLVYIGKIPVLYFPVIYKPLGEGTPIISQFYPGYDERNGFYLKSNYTYKYSSFHKLRIYLDYYSKKGFGTGGEFFGFKNNSFKYNISYYRINEYGRLPIYWGINGGTWYNIYSTNNKSLYFQSFIRLPSDPNFNNNYFRSNPFVISTTRQWDLSLTYQLPSSFLRLKSNTSYSSNQNSFFKSQEIIPKIEYQTITKKISFLPLSHSFYISVENRRLNESYFQKNSNIKYNIYSSVLMTKNFSLYNNIEINYDTNFTTSSQNQNISIAKYAINSSFRYSFFSGNIDLSYSGILRSSINKLYIDERSNDHGIEESLVRMRFFFIKNINENFSFNSGYDLKKYNYYISNSKRFLPFSFEYYKNISSYELYFKEVYSVSSGHKAFVTNMTTHMEKNYLTVGFSNYDTKKERFFISTLLGYNPIPKKGWHGEFGFRYYVDFSRDMSLKFYEKNFIINKEFHDFNTKFVIRSRKENLEFFFYITMKMNDPYRKDKIDSEIDKEFRPWRRFNEERDY